MGPSHADAALQHTFHALHLFPHWHAPHPGNASAVPCNFKGAALLWSCAGLHTFLGASYMM